MHFTIEELYACYNRTNEELKCLDTFASVDPFFLIIVLM